MTARVLDFYCDGGTDSSGRTLDDMIAMSDRELEFHHDIIQWMFPLHEASNFNPDCPLVDEQSAETLQGDRIAQTRMREVLERFASFLGFKRDASGQYESDPKLAANRANWQTPHNHNLLRITRVIRSLRLFGLEAESQSFFAAVYESACKSGCLSERTIGYWRLALEDPPFETLRK
ncbi:opioid growth factor receptor-related protein [Blastopirellula marina]|uniref:Opioid growth factor receptor (OGFr) conserved domain-containing protein n=1 Tax=Blastopirellula marina TaxID=124 RepID=A0A2S8G0N3_9BACT|nr:opioid growth factor receptor-related protein [Blastopirellula marina]PQO38005.1 hypothetical protein C5Y98_07910 [Blastopirellula marina]PTL44661.1 hypothetical protein C5Y97_07910 [Blastopirellula marina]